MAYLDARVQSNFIQYVLALQDPNQRTLTKEFLQKFLSGIIEHEQNPSKCSISLVDACEWLKMEKKNFKRLIDSDHTSRPTDHFRGRRKRMFQWFHIPLLHRMQFHILSTTYH